MTRMLLIATLLFSGMVSKAQSGPIGNWGISPGGINALQAQKLVQPSQDILIGIIDTGIDFNHPDLASSRWVNPKESGAWQPKNQKEADNAPNCFDKSCNKIDDDGNGYVDDVNGFDFILKKTTMSDTHGHGTHIAGIIAGAVNKERGIGGVAPGVKLSSYRYFDPQKPKMDALDMTIKGIKLAINHGVKIINYSGGGVEKSEEELEVLQEAERKGILVVVAAGNESTNLDLGGTYYPCSYGLSNIICVGNLSKYNDIPSSSNKGKRFVDVFAPGTNILSTAPNNSYAILTGTSQSTAFITGLAALMYSKNPNLSFAEIKQILATSTKINLPALKNVSKVEGKINAVEVLKTMDTNMAASQENTNHKDLKRASKSLKYSRSISASPNSSSKNGE